MAVFEVWRGGISSRYLVPERSPNVRIGTHRRGREDIDGVEIALQIASKGGGRTRVFLWISPMEFQTLTKAMFEANSLLALASFKNMKIKRAQPRKRTRKKKPRVSKRG